MFERLKAKLTGQDVFYSDIKEEQIQIYQKYFERVINAVDVQNNTLWSRGKAYDRARLTRDDDAMAKILREEAPSAGVNAAYLQMIVNQYFFADEYQRDRDRERWVKKVLARKSADYFPDAWAVRKLLEAAG